MRAILFWGKWLEISFIRTNPIGQIDKTVQPKREGIDTIFCERCDFWWIEQRDEISDQRCCVILAGLADDFLTEIVIWSPARWLAVVPGNGEQQAIKKQNMAWLQDNSWL